MNTLTLLVALLASPTQRAAAYDEAAAAALATGDLALAVLEWERAYAVDPDPKYLLAMAVGLSGRAEGCVRAAKAFQRFEGACGTCAMADEGRAAKSASRCTAELRVEPATVEVDGRPTTQPLTLWAGAHTLASVRGGRRHEITWCVRPGVKAELAFDGESPIEVDVDGAAQARAFAHQEAGLEHARAERFCAAVREFDKAYEARPEAGFLYNQGLAYSMWRGRCGEALRTFDRFLSACPDCPQAADARGRREQILGECTGTLEVVTRPGNARVRVAGQSGDAPMVVRVPPGRHRVVVTAPDHREISIDAPVDLGRTRTLVLELTPVAAEVPPPPPRKRTGAWTWMALTVSGVGFGTAAFFTLQAQQDLDEFDRLLALAQADQDTSYKDKLLGKFDDIERNNTIAYVGWGVGAVGAVTGAVLWLLEGPDEAGANAWRLLPTHNGLGVTRAF